MMRVPTLRSVTPVLLFATVLLAVSCGDDKSSDPGHDTNLPRQTRQGLLDTYARSIEEEDLEKYAACLDDKYIFIFLAADAETVGLPPGQPWWGKTQDVASTRNMFDAPNVGDIIVDLTTQIDWFWCVDIRGHETPPDTITGMCARYDPTIDVTIDRGRDSERTLIVRDSWLNVWVTPDPKSTKGEWVIVKIEEMEKSPKAPLRSSLTATDPQTFGSIKARFR